MSCKEYGSIAHRRRYVNDALLCHASLANVLPFFWGVHRRNCFLCSRDLKLRRSFNWNICHSPRHYRQTDINDCWRRNAAILAHRQLPYPRIGQGGIPVCSSFALFLFFFVPNWLTDVVATTVWRQNHKHGIKKSPNCVVRGKITRFLLSP